MVKFLKNKFHMQWAKKNKWVIIITLIFLMGVFLRGYNFSDWLHFELDQSRDAKVINQAVEQGPSQLPLLGPRAGGTFLRLGPIFYYFEYLSALVFGNTPEGMAVCVLIFGILTLPLFYYFSRQYFSQKISVALLAVFSVSLYVVVYSRFGWNPNPLPFFVLLILIASLKLARPEEKRKGLWLSILAGSYAVTAQLHFLAMIALAAFIFFFLLYARPKVSIKYWLLAVFVAAFVLSPMIINDIQTKGANTKEFFQAITKKSNNHKAGFLKKLGRNYFEHSAKYFLILTGREENRLVKINVPANNNIFKAKVIYDRVGKKDLLAQLVGLVFFTFGLVVLIKKLYPLIKKKRTPEKDFLVATLLFGVMSFGIFFPLALYLAPRFFLLAAPLPFILLGLEMEYILEKLKKYHWKEWIIALIALALVLSNLVFLKKHFAQLAEAPYKATKIDTSVILDERAKITLQQQRMVDEYMKSFYDQNHYPIYFNGEPQYQRALIYHLERWKIPVDGFRSNITNGGQIYREGNYFLVYLTISNLEGKVKRYEKAFDVLEKKSFGTFTVFRLQPKEIAITAQKEDFSVQKEKKENESVPKRFDWGEL